MGIDGLTALALALGGLFGLAGVALGLYAGVRVVQRDEERYAAVIRHVERRDQEWSQLRIDWGTTLERIEELATAVEKKRRQTAAAEGRMNAREPEGASEPKLDDLPPAQQRDAIRRRMRRVS